MVPTTPKRKQYIDQSVRVTRDIIADWTNKYPFTAAQKVFPVPNQTWKPNNDYSAYGHYKVVNVPY